MGQDERDLRIRLNHLKTVTNIRRVEEDGDFQLGGRFGHLLRWYAVEFQSSEAKLTDFAVQHFPDFACFGPGVMLGETNELVGPTPYVRSNLLIGLAVCCVVDWEDDCLSNSHLFCPAQGPLRVIVRSPRVTRRVILGIVDTPVSMAAEQWWGKPHPTDYRSTKSEINSNIEKQKYLTKCKNC